MGWNACRHFHDYVAVSYTHLDVYKRQELDESQLKEHDHTFFELVYILSGTGIQWINNNKFPYHDAVSYTHLVTG